MTATKKRSTRSAVRQGAKSKTTRGTIVAPFAPLLQSDWPRSPRLMDQAELAHCLNVDERTIRNYVDRGMPVAFEKPRPQYEFAKCSTWSLYLTWQTHQYQRNRNFRPLRRFSYQHALNWLFPRESEEFPNCGNEYCIVPLRLDHPKRAEQLQLACEGLPPLPPFDSEERETGEEI